MRSQAEPKEPQGEVHEIDRGRSLAGDGSTRRTLKLLTIAELRDRPRRSWLIEGFLPERGLSAIYGPPESGKTFVLLDLAAAIAVGREWCGRRVQQGKVVYVTAESLESFYFRLEALSSALEEEEKERLADGLRVVTDAFNLLAQGDVAALIEAVREQGETASLIIFDTLARCTVDFDENDACDMGLVVRACSDLSREVEATVLLAHHSLKNNPKVERGSSALRGGLDSMYRVTNCEGRLTLRCEKQKDAAHFDPIQFQLVQVELEGDGDGEVPTSCRVAHGTAAGSEARKPPRPEASGRRRRGTKEKVLAFFQDAGPGAVFNAKSVIDSTGCSSTRGYAVLGELVKAGVLRNREGFYKLSNDETVPLDSRGNPTGNPGSRPGVPGPSPTPSLKGGVGRDWERGSEPSEETGAGTGSVGARVSEEGAA